MGPLAPLLCPLAQVFSKDGDATTMIPPADAGAAVASPGSECGGCEPQGGERLVCGHALGTMATGRGDRVSHVRSIRFTPGVTPAAPADGPSGTRRGGPLPGQDARSAGVPGQGRDPGGVRSGPGPRGGAGDRSSPGAAGPWYALPDPLAARIGGEDDDAREADAKALAGVFHGKSGGVGRGGLDLSAKPDSNDPAELAAGIPAPADRRLGEALPSAREVGRDDVGDPDFVETVAVGHEHSVPGPTA